MGLGSWILVIALILGAWFFLAPTSFNATKDSIFGHKTVEPEVKTVEKIVYVNQTVNTTKAATLNASTPKSFSQTVVNTTNTTNTTNVTTPVVVDPCTLPYHGLPDYVGTNKEGQDCADTLVDSDFECLANPPTNYDGYIDVVGRFSSPNLFCCKTDGFCRWGYH